MLRRFILGIAFLLSVGVAPLRATDIAGVQPAALDQPRVNMQLRREPNGKPLATDTGEGEVMNIQAFLDTGASGVLLSGSTAIALGVKPITTPVEGKAQTVKFHDVGVGGGDAFGVSEPLYIFVAPYSSTGEPGAAADYPLKVGPVRTQISTGGGLLEMLTGGLDVLGMPAIKGHIIIMDPKPVDSFADTMRCGLFAPGKKNIPKTDRHVTLTYVDFQPYTRLEPPGAPGPTLAPNPMIGPNPITHAGGGKPVVATYQGREVSGTWLLDTGAAASMISTQQAARLGVTYVPGTEGTASPKLQGVPADRQFTLDVGGVGGTRKAAGFFLDTLVIPTREGDPLVYKPAPVLVNDITAKNSKTGRTITIDGVFGMNFMVASANVTQAGLMPDIKNLTAGPFEWIVIDEPKGVLGFKLKK